MVVVAKKPRYGWLISCDGRLKPRKDVAQTMTLCHPTASVEGPGTPGLNHCRTDIGLAPRLIAKCASMPAGSGRGHGFGILFLGAEQQLVRVNWRVLSRPRAWPDDRGPRGADRPAVHPPFDQQRLYHRRSDRPFPAPLSPILSSAPSLLFRSRSFSILCITTTIRSACWAALS